MNMNQLDYLDPKPIPSPSASTIYSTTDTAATPPETIPDDSLDDLDPLYSATSPSTSPSSSVPWPGATFILRAPASGHVLTLLDGLIAMAPPGGRGSIHWACVETKGWLGFRSPVSGKYLGYDAKGRLCCAAGRQQEWENFCARARPDGGYVLLMTHFERLWRVGVRVEGKVLRVAKIGHGEDDGLVWEFVKV
jgi:hypothetical protein